MALAYRIIVIGLLASILSILIVAVAIPYVQSEIRVAQDQKNIQGFLDEAKKHGY